MAVGKEGQARLFGNVDESACSLNQGVAMLVEGRAGFWIRFPKRLEGEKELKDAGPIPDGSASLPGLDLLSTMPPGMEGSRTSPMFVTH